MTLRWGRNTGEGGEEDAEGYLGRDASVPSVPQADVGGRLHLVRRCPGRLVALPIRAHLQVLVDDVWMGGKTTTMMWQCGI